MGWDGELGELLEVGLERLEAEVLNLWESFGEIPDYLGHRFSLSDFKIKGVQTADQRPKIHSFIPRCVPDLSDLKTMNPTLLALGEAVQRS